LQLQREAVRRLNENQIDTLVVIGRDGSLKGKSGLMPLMLGLQGRAIKGIPLEEVISKPGETKLEYYELAQTLAQ
jgi:6-phosphofructokinase